MVHASSKYTEQLGEKIASLLREGKTLREVCKRKDIPVQACTVLGWCEKPLTIMGSDGFLVSWREHYGRARATGYQVLFDRLAETADCAVDMAAIQKARLQIDVLKWTLSKALPRVFGDSIAIDHSGEITNATIDPRDLARSIMDVLAEGSGEEIMLQLETDSTKH